MALNKTRWGDNIAAAVKAIGITDQAKITDEQLKLIWRAMAQESMVELAANAVVAPGTMNIINPETSAPVPVTGNGGPIT